MNHKSIRKAWLLRAFVSTFTLCASLVMLKAQEVVNVQFGDGGATAQTGVAGAGVSSNDYWNLVQGASKGGDDDGGSGNPYDVFVTASSLLDNNQNITGVNLHLLLSDNYAEQPCSQYSGADAVPLINSCVLIQGGDSFTVEVDLPAGRVCDLYLYASLPYGSSHYTSTFTLDGSSSKTPSSGSYPTDTFVENHQYVVFRNVASGSHYIQVSSGVEPFMNGMQIVMHHSLVNIQFGDDRATAMVGPAATGLTPGDYWNLVEGATKDNNSDGGSPQEVFVTAGSLLDNYRNTTGVNLYLYRTDNFGDPPYSQYFVSDPIPLINSHLFDQAGGDSFTLGLDLPSGNIYDIYLYSAYPDADGADGVYAAAFSLDGSSQANTSNGSYPVDTFVEGNQYVVFRGVGSGSHNIDVLPLPGSATPAMNGLQIVIH